MVGLKLFVPTSMPTMRPVRYEYSGGAGGPGTTGPALPPEKSKGGEKTYKEVLEDKEDQRERLEGDLIGRNDLLAEVAKREENLQNELDGLLIDYTTLEKEHSALQDEHNAMQAKHQSRYELLENRYRENENSFRELTEESEKLRVESLRLADENRRLKSDMEANDDYLAKLEQKVNDDEDYGDGESASTGALINWL